MTAAQSTVVIGVGNPFRHDDGVGHVAIAELRREDPDLTCLTVDGQSTNLLAAWQGHDRAVIVDAVVSGAAPGQVHHLELGRDQLPVARPATSSHGAGVAEAVGLGTALDRLPTRLVLFGVEVADVSPGMGLSPAVTAALPRLLTELRRHLACVP